MSCLLHSENITDITVHQPSAKEQHNKNHLTKNIPIQSHTISPKQANNLFALWSAQVDQLISCTQFLANLINAKSIHPKNPKEAQAWLFQLSQKLTQFKKSHPPIITIAELAQRFKKNELLLKLFQDTLTQNLNLLPNFSMILTQKKPVGDLHSAALTTYAEALNQHIAHLQQYIEGYGYSWLNTKYAKVSDLYFTNKKSLTTVLGIGTTAGIIGTLGWLGWQHHETATKEINEVVYNQGFRQNVYVQALNALMISTATYTLNNISTIQEKIKNAALWCDDYLRGIPNNNQPKRGLMSAEFIEDLTLADPRFDCIRPMLEPFNTILSYLERPGYFMRTGMKVPKSILLTGPSGSGKSFSAKALAGSIQKLFRETGRTEQFGFLPVGPNDFFVLSVKEVINHARSMAPCVLFIDELHLLGHGLQTHRNSTLLSELLVELDQLDQDTTHPVFVVAATNRPDRLDSALTREGRFGTQIRFPIPTLKQRIEALHGLCKKSAIDPTELHLDKIARLLPGISLSALTKLFEHASLLAQQQGILLNYEHLYEALNAKVRQLGTKIELAPEEQKIVAAHMAGKGVAFNKLTTNELESLTIRPVSRKIEEKVGFSKNDLDAAMEQHVTEHGRYYTFENTTYRSHKDLETECKLHLAGLAAEKLLLGAEHNYREEERKEALHVAQKILLGGLDFNELSRAQQEKTREDSVKLIEKYYAEIYQLLKENKAALESLMDTLLKKHFLQQEEIAQILNNS